MTLLRILSLVALILAPRCLCAADFNHISREIRTQPTFKHKPRYALAVLGADARFKLWLILDGDTLYVDKNGNGDLTEPGEAIKGVPEKYLTVFKAGDITVGDATYKQLEIRVEKLKDYADLSEGNGEFQKLINADPQAPGYAVSVDVPLAKVIKDKKGRPVPHLRHFVSLADANGLFQFAADPKGAPIVHFGGPWSVWPRHNQKFVLGREEEFTVVLGTPGSGPGTLALIQYHTLGDDREMFVPDAARPILAVQFKGKEGKSIDARYELQDRC